MSFWIEREGGVYIRRSGTQIPGQIVSDVLTAVKRILVFVKYSVERILDLTVVREAIPKRSPYNNPR